MEMKDYEAAERELQAQIKGIKKICPLKYEAEVRLTICIHKSGKIKKALSLLSELRK